MARRPRPRASGCTSRRRGARRRVVVGRRQSFARGIRAATPASNVGHRMAAVVGTGSNPASGVPGASTGTGTGAGTSTGTGTGTGTEERRPSIAVVDDDSGFAGYLRTFLGVRGYEARS